MKNLETICNDLQDLRGADVKIFGQNTTLNSEVDDMTIDALKVINNLKGFEDDYLNMLNDNELDEELNNNYELVKSDNSFNWNSPLSNHMDFKIYKDLNTNDLALEIKFHRYGDVRSNYTNEIFLRFEDDYQFFDVLLESSNYFDVIVDDVKYSCDLDVLSENVRVYNQDLDLDLEIYASDIEDLKEEIKKEVLEWA